MSSQEPKYEVNVYDAESDETLVDIKSQGFIVVTTNMIEKDGKPFSRLEGMMHNLNSKEIVQMILWTIEQDATAKTAFEQAFVNLLKQKGES